MFRTKNDSPFLFGYRVCSRKPPKPEMTCIVRGAFELAPNQPLVPKREKLSTLELEDEERAGETDAVIDEAERQLGQGVLSADRFEEGDDERTGQLVYPSDFAEFKLNAEIMVRGSCHPPAATSQCRVRVEVGRWSKELMVTGHRAWVDKVMGGQHTDPLAFRSMPLDYRYAYGGPGFADNPVGKGHESEHLPNVEDPAHPITRAGQAPRPAGFGPVNPEWPARLSKRGKDYGEDYEKRYEPWYPADFDWSYLHAAPPDQQLRGYLQGGETLRFVNLHADAADFTTEVPKHRPRVFIQRVDGEQVEVDLAIDTLFADLEEGVLYVTWRGLTPVSQDDLADVACALVVCDDEGALSAADHLATLTKLHDDPIGLQDGDLGKLKELHDKIEDGRIKDEIEAVPEDDKVLVNIFDKLLSPLLAEPHLGLLRGQAASMMEQAGNDPSVPRKIKDEVIKALDQSLDPMGPGMGVGRDGKMHGTAAPMVTRALGEVARAQKEAMKNGNVDMTEVDARLKDALASIDDEGLKGALGDLDMAALREREATEPAPQADLRGVDLSDRDLSGRNLTGIQLDGAILARTNLSGAILDGASMTAAVLSRTDLSGASLVGADLTLAMMSRTRCTEASFEGATMDQASLIQADFSRANLNGVSAVSTQGSRAIFAEAKLRGADYEFSTFDNCDFRGADLREVKLRRTMFRQCSLAFALFDHATMHWCGFLESDLSGARFFQTSGELSNWQGATLNEADFSFCSLSENMFMNVSARRAKFRCANLPEVRFYKAVLREADFEKANMFSADMRKTSLTNARFVGANLYQARFIEAFGTDTDFTGAKLEMANFKRNKLVSRGT